MKQGLGPPHSILAGKISDVLRETFCLYWLKFKKSLAIDLIECHLRVTTHVNEQ